jgi:DNA primase
MKTASGWNIHRLPDNLPSTVEEVLSYLGIDYEPSWSDEVAAYCPFHDDVRSPSFSVSSAAGLWYCHKCGIGGNLPQLVEAVTGVRFTRARTWLEQVDYDAEAAAVREPVSERDYFAWQLKRYAFPPEHALERRHISVEAAQHYGIRYRFEVGAWILPIWGPDDGSLLGWQTKRDGGTPQTSYGTPKSRSLFGIDVHERGSMAILVEDALDAARLRTAGFPGGVASFGAHVSRHQAELLAERAGVIVSALDNDPAGREGQAKLLDHLSRLHATTTTVAFNYGRSRAKDPGELDDAAIRWGIRHVTQV